MTDGPAGAGAGTGPAAGEDPPGAAVVRALAIRNAKGLHARASARFVETVEAHDAAATVEKDGMTVSGDSIMGLLMLAAARGSTITVACTGRQAVALADALQALVGDLFGEGM